jgi:hypothetical protein
MTDLRIGNHYDGATPQYDSTTTRLDNDGREVEAFRVVVHDKSTRSTQHAPAPFGPNDTPEAILGPVHRDIEAKREMLNRHNGFDPKTGAPNWLIQGDRRANLERELTHLTQFTLPLTQLRADEAAAWHAAQPTRAEKFQAEAERRQAIQTRALSIAEELEAEREAERILKARRQGV